MSSDIGQGHAAAVLQILRRETLTENQKLAHMHPRAIALLHWHWRELEGLLDRMTPGSIGYDVIETRANELADLLNIKIEEVT